MNLLRKMKKALYSTKFDVLLQKTTKKWNIVAKRNRL